MTLIQVQGTNPERNYIQYFKRSVYGKTLFYLAPNQILETAIFGLTGKKTLDLSDLENLKKLGLILEEVIDSF